MSQFEARNISMMMDLYEMTMANGYFEDSSVNDWGTFEVFYRKNPDSGGFAIFAGLEQVVEYIEGMHFEEDDIEYFRSLHLFSDSFLEFLRGYHFRGNISAFPEGTIMYPNEPVLTVHAPLIDAQLVETAILAQINHQSLIATKAQRIVRAAKGRGVLDFGARRSHNIDAAVYGARAAYIGGVDSTATVMAGKQFGIPVSGTMAHSWVMCYGDEYTAFCRYAERYPDSAQFLVDTYDVLHSGVPNAIKASKAVLNPQGKRLKGVRLDSGDLAYLSKKVRRMLDEEGMEDCMIIASNSLDESTITSLLEQGGCIDAFGVGERLITAKSDPVFGAVYKLAAIEQNGVCTPRIKVSENIEKITNPGKKDVYRIYDDTGHAVADLLTAGGEAVDLSKEYPYIDPQKPWKKRTFTNCRAKKLHREVILNGKRAAPPRSLESIRAYVKEQLDSEIWQEEQRFFNPHRHYLDMSIGYYQAREELLDKNQWK